MKSNQSNTKGFSLIEVVLALGISVFALVTILALLPAGLGANQASIQQTAAVNLATAIVADLRQTPSAPAVAASGGSLTAISPTYKINFATSPFNFYLDDSGSNTGTAPFTTLTPTSHYKVAVTLTQPPTGARTATYGSVIVSWPAASPNALNAVSAFIALDRN